MFILYNLLVALLSPIWAVWMLWRSRKRAESPIWAERFGRYSMPIGKDVRRVWIHAVSVGEVVSVLPVLKELRNRLPDHEIVLSVTTSSGHRTAREQAQGLYDHLAYFPIDVTRFQFNAMTRVRPSVVAVVDTELWMNFLWAAKVVGARTMLINGRISDRSYPRSLKVKFFYRALLGYVDRCLMQTDTYCERIRALGARSAERFGNTKFDQAAADLAEDPTAWRKELGLPLDKPVLVVGSTRGEEEEALVLQAVERVGLDRLCVVHAPRHLERVPELAESVKRSFGAVALRSKRERGDYVLLDTYGELSKVYCVAFAVVVGGAFADLGGQNLVQPLAHGKPVLHGPHMQNFSEIANEAAAEGASRVCANAEELAEALVELLDCPSKAKAMGDRAKALVNRNLGASARYAAAIAEAAHM